MTLRMIHGYFNEKGCIAPAGGTFSAGWQSPSNIALVKYWGKKEGQVPMNPSLSMTLSKAVTRTKLSASPGGEPAGLISVNREADHPFVPKMKVLLEQLVPVIPCLSGLAIRAETENTFPHSAGIASSASGMSAFALCLLDIAVQMTHTKPSPCEWDAMASEASRMGSGSACRSVYGGFALWGKTNLVPSSGDDHAVDVSRGVHPVFLSMHDAILIVSSGKKQVSSTIGHGTMPGHPYLEGRIRQANVNTGVLLRALAGGDFEQVASVSENEALSLHALLMTAMPPIILVKPATMEIINRVQEARKGGMPVFFTLDAGANVHVLYPKDAAGPVEHFINEVLVSFCEDGRVIYDECGPGPVKLGMDLEKVPQ